MSRTFHIDERDWSPLRWLAHHLANTGSGDLVMLVVYHPARTRNP